MAKLFRRAVLFLGLITFLFLTLFWGLVLWIPREQAFQAVNQYLQLKTGLSFRYQLFDKALGEVRFRQLEIYDGTGVIAEAKSLDWGFRVSLRNGLRLNNFFSLEGFRGDWKKIALVFKNRRVPASDTGSASSETLLKRILSRTGYQLAIRDAEVVIAGKKLFLSGNVFQDGSSDWNAHWGALELLANGKDLKSLTIGGQFRPENQFISSLRFQGAAHLQLPDVKLDPLKLKVVWKEGLENRFSFLQAPVSLEGSLQVAKTISGEWRFDAASFVQGNVRFRSDRQLQEPEVSWDDWKMQNLGMNGPGEKEKVWNAGIAVFTSRGKAGKRDAWVHGSIQDLVFFHPTLATNLYFPKVKFDFFRGPGSPGKMILKSDLFRLGNGEYSADAEWDLAEKTLRLNGDGNLFDKDWLLPSGSGKKSDFQNWPKLSGRIGLGRLIWGNQQLLKLQSDWSLDNKRFVWTNTTFGWQDQDFLMSGHFLPEDKQGGGVFSCDSFDLKPMEPFLKESNSQISVRGKLSARGTYDFSPGVFEAGADFENIGSILMDGSSYQRRIWRLPFIGSKKSLEDVFQKVRGHFSFRSRDGERTFRFDRVDLLSEEFALGMSGSIRPSSPGPAEWKFSLDILFSEYFLAEHVILNEGMKRFSRIAPEGHPLREINQGLIHLIQLDLEKKEGQTRHVFK